VFARGAVRLLGPAAALLLFDLALLVAVAPPIGRAAEVALAPLAVLVAFLAIFYRDPDRAAGEGVVSAADGRIRAVERAGDRWLVSVFLGVLDVHVNRWPIDGEVEGIESAGAGFRPAYRADAEGNVRRHYRLRTAVGPVEVVQITGIVARRLVSFVGDGAQARKGERFGMIVLGSRVDVLLPADRTAPTVRTGERVRAGRSTIARILP
jgi:phosphatidylserine decarboxylase